MSDRRPNRLPALALSVMALLLASSALSLYFYVRDRRCLQADRRATAVVIEVHRVQLALASLLGKHSDMHELRREWSEANAQFGLQFSQLRVSPGLSVEQQARLSHVEEAWLRGEMVNQQVEELLGLMDSRHLSDRIGASGLGVAYERMLSDPKVQGHDIGLLGRLLTLLEDYDRQLQDMDTELRSFSELAHEEAELQGFRTKAAGAVTLLLALSGVAFLLLRILRLHEQLLRDNAARIKAEDTARAHEEDLRITLDSIGDAVIATDVHGCIVRMNPVAERLTGWPEREAVGRPLDECFRILNPRTRQPVRSPVETVMERGKVVSLEGQTSLAARNGVEHQIADSAAPILDGLGRLRGIVIVFRDVTTQMRLEEQLRMAQKMESVGKLAGGVAHDFNNILQVIRANLVFLNESSGFHTPDSLQSLEQIRQASDRAVSLTRQLLAFGRRQKLEVVAADPERLVSGVLRLLRRLIGENIEVHFICQPGHRWVSVDVNQFEQVILNLCVNARDAMPEGGRMELQLRSVSFPNQSPSLPVGAQPGDYTVISVIDNGRGMDEATLGRIFEPFFTTKPVGQGTGLGLSVAQGIIQQHGGFITVESKPEQGSAFHVHLPSIAPIAVESSGEVVATSSGLFQRRPAASGLILLAEDEISVRSIAERILVKEGFRVIAAVDGEQACGLAAVHAQELSLVVLDVMMPRLSGIEAARRIRELRPEVPIIFCSGYDSDVELARLGDFPNWHYLGKPHSSDELVQAVHVCLGKAKASGGETASGPASA